VSPRLENFLWRVEQLIDEGGFALITGDSGTGKSSAMRVLHDRLDQMREVNVAHIDRPQSSVADFYRELGDAFGISVAASNRWGGFRALREKWRATLEASLTRPVLLVDEAQEMSGQVLAELRILSAEHFDSRSLLTIILAGDSRLPERFRCAELAPLGSRIRTRLVLETQSIDDANQALRSLLETAGNPRLFTAGLGQALAEQTFGNFRALANLANELLVEAAKRELDVIDEKLFLDYVASRSPRSTAATRRQGRTKSKRT
jgi:type II secretory pathway predicted ATPase ExeA